jgi:hypothetical protein
MVEDLKMHFTKRGDKKQYEQDVCAEDEEMDHEMQEIQEMSKELEQMNIQTVKLEMDEWDDEMKVEGAHEGIMIHMKGGRVKGRNVKGSSVNARTILKVKGDDNEEGNADGSMFPKNDLNNVPHKNVEGSHSALFDGRTIPLDTDDGMTNSIMFMAPEQHMDQEQGEGQDTSTNNNSGNSNGAAPKAFGLAGGLAKSFSRGMSGLSVGGALAVGKGMLKKMTKAKTKAMHR